MDDPRVSGSTGMRGRMDEMDEVTPAKFAVSTARTPEVRTREIKQSDEAKLLSDKRGGRVPG